MSGASLLDIATILGHKSITMTQRYAHLSHDHTHAVVERMNRAIPG
jgi:site-specific recombinase XerD